MDARRTTLAAAGERKAGTGGLAPPQHHSGCLPKGKQCHETHLRNAGGGVRIGPGRLYGSRDTLAHRKPNRHIDGDGGAHLGADGDGDGNADRRADFGADGDSDRDPHGFADGNANSFAQRDPHANRDSNANRDPDGNTDSNANRDTHGNTDPNANRDPDGNTDPNANRDSNANTFTDPHANPNHGHPRQPAPDSVGWRSRLLEEVPES
ncbi:hypothetical protein GCM10010052_37730 [Paenarthrobacter histidinolovorans]|nr:hypothetical protein GCM10010052_37730 [Paenarthrobacter histidinolovorans]